MENSSNEESNLILKEALASWDKKSASDIEQIYCQHQQDDDFFDNLLLLTGDAELSTGATWLVKHHLEQGATVSNLDSERLLMALPKLQCWQPQLHILQIISHLVISKTARAEIEPFLRYAISDTNKFIRAWSFNAMYVLATQYPELQSEVLELLELAMKDEPASVKARVRKLLDKGFKRRSVC